MLAFVHGVFLKNGVEIPPNQNNQSFYKGTDAPTIIGSPSIDNDMTTPKSFHDAATRTESISGSNIIDSLQFTR